MQSPSEPELNQLTPKEPSLVAPSNPLVPALPAKRRASAVLLSVAMHGSLLALVVLAGEVARHRFIAQPTTFQAMAMVKVAGGSDRKSVV